MMIKKFKIFMLMIATSLLLSACSISIPGVVRKEYKMGNIDYNVIDISSKEFNELNKGDFQNWYELNYKNGGVYNFSKDGNVYSNWCRGETYLRVYNEGCGFDWKRGRN
jgi:hypothetical protein